MLGNGCCFHFHSLNLQQRHSSELRAEQKVLKRVRAAAWVLARFCLEVLACGYCERSFEELTLVPL